MECLRIPIYAHFKNLLFCPIRKRSQLISVLINSIKLIVSFDERMNDVDNDCFLEVFVNKQSRIFLYNKEKIVSFNFPLKIKKKDIICESMITFGDYFDVREYLNDVLVFIENLSVDDSDSIESFMDSVLYCNETDEFWSLLHLLLTFEPGYLRYDYDELNYQDNTHPLNHLDLFYTSSNTFKIGLKYEIDIDNFKSILNINKECFFIET